MDDEFDSLLAKIEALPEVRKGPSERITEFLGSEVIAASINRLGDIVAGVETDRELLEQVRGALLNRPEQAKALEALREDFAALAKAVLANQNAPDKGEADARDAKLLHTLGAMLATIKPAQPIEPAKPGRPTANKGVTYEAVPERNVQDRITRVIIRPI